MINNDLILKLCSLQVIFIYNIPQLSFLHQQSQISYHYFIVLPSLYTRSDQHKYVRELHE